MSAATGHRRAARWIGIACVAILVLGGGMCVGLSVDGSLHMRRCIAGLPAQVEAIRARDGRRAVLRGEPREGRAWEEYEGAVALADGLRRRPIYSLGFWDDNGLPQEVAALTEEFAPAITALSRGARCHDGNRSFTLDPPTILGIPPLADLTVWKARLLAADGRVDEAIDLVSDLLTFAHDVTANTTLLPHYYGLIVYRKALDVLPRLLLEQGLQTARFAELARRLEIVESSFPSLQVTWRNDAIWVKHALAAAWNGERPDLLRGLASALGRNRLYAEAARRLDEQAEHAASLAGRSWDDVRHRDDPLPYSRQFWNPLLQVVRLNVTGGERSWRDVLARLRLLRAHATWRATGRVPDLEDPFGGRIQADTDLRRFWSRGADGYDHHGGGVWEDGGLDIVLQEP